jgi:hypothetical protein
MATMTERLAFLISANADQAIRAFEKTANSAEKELGKAENKIDKVAGSLSKFGAGGMAFAGVAGAALMGFAREAENAEAQSRKLGNSIENAGTFAEGAQGRLEQLAKDIQKVTTADGDAIVGMQSLLAQFGLTEEQIKSLSPLVVDLSSKMGVDMDTAAKAVAKSATGSETALKKMGIQVDKASAGGDSFDATMTALAGTVGGFAEKEAETFSGKIEQLKISLGDLQEGVGSGVIDVFGSAVGGLNNLSTALGEIDPDIQNTVGQVAGFATVAIGLASSLSFVAGQTIKMRDRFVDAEGKMNAFGKTAAFAGGALGALAIAQTVGTVLNEISDASGNVDRKLQALVIAIGDVENASKDSIDPLETFRDLVAAEGKGINLGNIFKDVGKEIKIAGGEIGRDIEYIDQAFTKLMDTSPELANDLLDAWQKQTDALDHNSTQYEDNLMLIDRYRERLGLATSASDVLTGATDGTAGALDDLSESTDDATEATIGLTGEWNHLLNQFSRDESLTNIKTKLDEANEAIQKAFSTGNQEDIDAAAQAVRDLYGDVGDYIKQVGDIPAEKQTEILALLNAGDYAGVLKMLNELERTRTAMLKVQPYVAGFASPSFVADLAGRASGGPIQANRPYIVGELGPEIVVPDSSGTVIPNNMIGVGGGGSSSTVNVTVTSSDPNEVVRALQRYVRLHGNLPKGIL